MKKVFFSFTSFFSHCRVIIAKPWRHESRVETQLRSNNNNNILFYLLQFIYWKQLLFIYYTFFSPCCCIILVFLHFHHTFRLIMMLWALCKSIDCAPWNYTLLTYLRADYTITKSICDIELLLGSCAGWLSLHGFASIIIIIFHCTIVSSLFLDLLMCIYTAEIEMCVRILCETTF